MDKFRNREETSETSRLLGELDLAIDRSGLIRDIIGKYQELRGIETITGPSRLTRVLREEIQIMEQKLRFVRRAHGIERKNAYAPP